MNVYEPMSRIVYVNGRYVPYGEAAVHAEDRGFQFADAIYEVIEVLGGALVDERRHLDRLERSLGEIGMRHADVARGAAPCDRAKPSGAIACATASSTCRSRAARRPREFSLPGPDVPQTRRRHRAPARASDNIAAQAAEGITVISMRDTRWARCDIKTVMLLPAVLAKDAAKGKGAREVWFIDDAGNVTEGASSNAWIVTKDSVLVTRPLSNRILPGVTRATAIDTARALGFAFKSGRFHLEEAYLRPRRPSSRRPPTP